MRVQETHIKGCGVVECLRGSECEVWEDMEGGVVWCGVDERRKGRGKEECALLISSRVWEGTEAQKWKGSRTVWTAGKVGMVKYAWVCVYAPVNARNGKGREEMRKFWNDVNECLRKIVGGKRVVLIRDMNGRVGNSEVAGVVRKWGVDRVNENGEHLVDICAERGLFLANTFFQHKMIRRYMWRRKRDERGAQKSMLNYKAVDKKMRKDALNAKVVRRMFEGSDHYTVLAKIKVRGRWEYGRSNGKEKVKKVLASEGMDRKEVREEYRRKVCERLREATMAVGEGTSINVVFNVFKRCSDFSGSRCGWV